MDVFVSYRLQNAIYWTSRRIHLPEGEPVLVDGKNMIRARCGNRIAFEPPRRTPKPPDNRATSGNLRIRISTNPKSPGEPLLTESDFQPKRCRIIGFEYLFRHWSCCAEDPSVGRSIQSALRLNQPRSFLLELAF